MRCCACNVILTDLEASRKFADSNRYVDMCSKCAGFLPEDLNTVVNPDLEGEELVFDVDDELASLDYVDYDDDFDNS